MAVAHQVDAQRLARQIRMRRRQLGQHRVRPGRPRQREQPFARMPTAPPCRRQAPSTPSAPSARHAAAGSGASHRHSRARRRRTFTLSHDGARTGPLGERPVQLQVRDEPRRVTQLRRAPARAPPAARRAGAAPRTAAPRARLAGVSSARRAARSRPTRRPPPRAALAARAARVGRCAAARACGCASRCDEPRIALGPRQHRVALVVLVARRVKAVAAREVVQPRPRRHLRGAGAVVVATAIVEVPAQLRVRQPARIEPLREGHARRARHAPRATPHARSESRTAPHDAAFRRRRRSARYCARSTRVAVARCGSSPSCHWPSMYSRSCGLWHR